MDDIVWQGTVDENKYLCSVTRMSERTGRLTVTVAKTNEVVLDTIVGLSYGAIFGPDVSDVHEWQESCITSIDEFERRK